MPLGPRILIADDHDLFRRGLRYALLDTMPDARVTEAATLDRALELLAEHQDIGLASFEIRMPGMREGQALPAIRRVYPALPIAVLSGKQGRQVILEMLEFGASGFIPKSLPAEDIVAAMQEIMAGRIYVPATIIAISEGDNPDDVTIPAMGSRPFDQAGRTPRQREVFELMAAGKSTKEIARSLEIAEGTVKIYLAAIFRQLNARNRVEAVAKSALLKTPDVPK